MNLGQAKKEWLKRIALVFDDDLAIVFGDEIEELPLKDVEMLKKAGDILCKEFLRRCAGWKCITEDAFTLNGKGE